MAELGPKVRNVDVECSTANRERRLVSHDQVLHRLTRDDLTLVGGEGHEAGLLVMRQLDGATSLLDLPCIEVDCQVLNL
jgi:hypothetical protein